jgi:hypothetical protein
MTHCAWLARNHRLLLDKFATRDKLIGLPDSDSDLKVAEYHVIRANRIISRHRRSCPTCISNERTPPANLRPLPGEAPVLPVKVQ